MGQVAERKDQPGALKVDEHKGDRLRREGQCHGEDPGLDHFRFARAGHAGYQAVGAVLLFVDVKVKGLAGGTDADGHRHPLFRLRLRPARHGGDVPGPAHTVSL